jgi:hypothetical protein
MSRLVYLSFITIPLIYILYKTIRSKKPIYLLGIPFLHFMDRAIYFDKIAYRWTLYTGMNGIWVMVFSLLIVWFINIIWHRRRTRITRQPVTLFGSLKPFKGEIPIILLLFLLFLNTGINTIKFPSVYNVLNTSFDAISIFVGYILVRGIIANTGLTDIMDFIKSLCLITAVSAFLFFLQQGWNIHIYDDVESMQENFGYSIVTRSTWYFPPLTYLLFSSGLVNKKWNVYVAATWLLAILAYFFSFTRTYIIGALFLIFYSFILKTVKFRSLKYMRLVPIVIIGIVIGGWLSSFFLPVQSKYMIDRLSQGYSSLGSDSSTLAVRWTWISNTWEMIKPNFLLGIGSPGIINFPNQFWTDEWVWDSWIVMALQYWGITGIVLIILLFYSGLRLAWKYFFSSDEELQFLGLLFILILTAVVIEGIFGPVFMEPYRFPLGFWYFAFLYGIASRVEMKRGHGLLPSLSRVAIVE